MDGFPTSDLHRPDLVWGPDRTGLWCRVELRAEGTDRTPPLPDPASVPHPSGPTLPLSVLEVPLYDDTSSTARPGTTTSLPRDGERVVHRRSRGPSPTSRLSRTEGEGGRHRECFPVSLWTAARSPLSVSLQTDRKRVSTLPWVLYVPVQPVVPRHY